MVPSSRFFAGKPPRGHLPRKPEAELDFPLTHLANDLMVKKKRSYDDGRFSRQKEPCYEINSLLGLEALRAQKVVDAINFSVPQIQFHFCFNLSGAERDSTIILKGAPVAYVISSRHHAIFTSISIHSMKIRISYDIRSKYAFYKIPLVWNGILVQF